jgi:antitoxin component HigA of HigAB toxin-antitoxin module
MDQSAFDLLHRYVPRAPVFALILTAAFLAGCGKNEPPPPVVEEVPVPAEVDDTKQKLTAATNNVEAKNTELTAANAAVAAAKTQLAEKDVVIGTKEAQIKKLQSEIDALKKRDAFVFAEIAAIQQQGQYALALSRYEQFIKDFPKSPLADNATTAMNQLTVATEKDARQKAIAADPKSRTREFLQQFEDGFLTLQDLAPVLKKKSVAQVLALLGPPNRVFGDGTEIGYVDKAIDPNTGKRGIFIIAFELDTVANLRVEYAGRRMVP